MVNNISQWDRNVVDTDLGGGIGYRRWFYSLSFNNDFSMWTASVFYGTSGIFIYVDVHGFNKTYMDVYIQRTTIDSTIGLQYTIIALGY